MLSVDQYCDALGLRQLSRREKREISEKVNDEVESKIGGVLKSKYPGIKKYSEDMVNIANFDIRAHNYDARWSDQKSLYESYGMTVVSDIMMKGFGVDSGRVYEFGCGTGSNLCMLAMEHPKVDFYGFDASLGMIEVANGKKKRLGLENLEFLVSSNSSNQMPDGSAKLTIAARVGSYNGLVQEMYRVLESGGILAILAAISKNARNRDYPNRQDGEAFDISFKKIGVEAVGMGIFHKSYRQRGNERSILSSVLKKA